MIILAKYRDIPWEEVSPHVPRSREFNQRLWNEVRGKEISVKTPPLEENPEYALCEGPFYSLVHSDGTEADVLACIHYLDIGD